MPIDDLTALGQKMREARKNKNRHGDRNAGSFIGYTGSIHFKFFGQLCQFFHRFLGVM